MQRAAESPAAQWTGYGAIGALITLFAMAGDGACKPKSDDPAPVPKASAKPVDAGAADAAAGDAAPGDGGFVMRSASYPALGAAFEAILRDKPRVLGIGELHLRTDRPGPLVSALSRFSTDALPVLASQTSDLVLETWMVDPACKTGAAATAKVETAMKRPASTKNEIAALFGLTKANSIKAHVMRLTCDDLAAVAPAGGGDVDAEKMLDLVTRELGRIARSAVRYRDEHSEARPLIVVYGGALHNDLYPYESTARWSYAGAVDQDTHGRFVEVDLLLPELIEGNKLYEQEEWYPLVARHPPEQVLLVERAPHSYVVILPKS